MNGLPLSHHQTFSISPHRFRQKPRSRLPNRRVLLLASSILAVIFIFFFPTISAIAGASLGSTIFRDDPLITTVHHYDLAASHGSGRGWERQERVLMLIPLRDAAPHLPLFFSHLRNLTYPHSLIDMAYLVSDSKDETLLLLSSLLERLQSDQDPYMRFGRIDIFEKDFGQVVGQGFSDRHGFEAQGPRRKLMARARNWLLTAALRPEHSWVYWRDVDVEIAPPTLIEDLMRHNKDVIVPNIWRPLPDWLGGEQPYDLNSWQESETALQLAQTLEEDAVIVEGYQEIATWRPHLAYLRDPYGDPDYEMEIDGVGGVSILAKASVFRSGAHFPAFSFEKHAETEGFGKMCKRMGFSVIGLPHYVIWHIYEPSIEDMQHMAHAIQDRIRKEEEEKDSQDKTSQEKSQQQQEQENSGDSKQEGQVDNTLEKSGSTKAGADHKGPTGPGRQSPLDSAPKDSSSSLLEMYDSPEYFLDSVTAAQLRAAKQVAADMEKSRIETEQKMKEEQDALMREAAAAKRLKSGSGGLFSKDGNGVKIKKDE
ncbi:Anp1-domain-containing protein [Lipomyces oligophaga]|uniref:Anp1-domain-containing protein n=1 Tax=Lipomyces oligophaga TaxID=45792 RepID=UPI0034CD645D